VIDKVTIIRSHKGLLDFDYCLLWRYRDLLSLFAKRDIKVRYRQTVLGPAWVIIKPLVLTGVLTTVISGFAGLSTDNQPAPLFYLTALVVWSFFSESVQKGGTVFLENSYLFSKIYFPRLIVVLATIISTGIGFVIQIVFVTAMIGAYAFFSDFVGLSWRILLFPLVVLELVAFSLAVAIWIANSTTKYRDLVAMIPFIIQLSLFVTPVIFPFSAIPEGYRLLASLFNPLAVIVDMTRWCFLGVSTVTSLDILASLLTTAVCLITGLLVFLRVERTAVDTV
jgi:homopolymeric O-antigen transport system permease protein